MSFVFTTCCFMAAFCGSTLLALLEKCSMERMWALIRRVKETLMAMFPDSWQSRDLFAFNPHRHINASCICHNTDIAGLVGSKGLIKPFILALIIRWGGNGLNRLRSGFWLGTAGSSKRALSRLGVSLCCRRWDQAAQEEEQRQLQRGCSSPVPWGVLGAQRGEMEFLWCVLKGVQAGSVILRATFPPTELSSNVLKVQLLHMLSPLT